MTDPKPKSPIGPTALLIVILVDVGLIILGWYVHQSRKASLDDSGLSLSKAPESAAPAPLAPEVEEQVGEGSLKFIVKEKRRGRPSAGRPQARPGETPGGQSSSKGSTGAVARAVRFFFDLKKDPRFRNSPAIAEWKRDFLSYPDLQALDAAYRKDGDALRFMVRMVRSPSFQEMFRKHILKPEIQGFVGEMSRSPAVMDSSKTFLEDPNISAAVRDLGFGPSSGTPPPAGEDQQAGAAQQAPSALRQGASEAIQKASQNPTLKKYLESEEAPAVKLK